MKIKIEQSGPCRKAMTVEIEPEQAAAEYEKVLEFVIREAELPGFRKGRAPRELVERRMAKFIGGEVGERLVNLTCNKAMEQQQLDPVAILDIKAADFQPGKPWSYTVVLDVPPEFKLPKYKGLPLRAEKAKVTEDDVNKRIEALRDAMAEYVDVNDRPARKGDVALIDFKAVLEPNLAAAVPKDYPLLLGDTGFWFKMEDDRMFPGLADGLVGAVPGDKRDVTVNFGNDLPVKALAGKSVQYAVLVHRIREEVRPALDEAFFKKIGVESEVALRDHVRAVLVSDADNLTKERMRLAASEALLKKVDLEVPASVVADETRVVFRRLIRRRLMEGASRADVDRDRMQVLAEASQVATDHVKLSYILHRIAEEEHIVVEDTEIDRYVEALARRLSKTADELRSDLQKNGELDWVRREIRMSKALDIVVANATAPAEGLLGRIFGGRGAATAQ